MEIGDGRAGGEAGAMDIDRSGPPEPGPLREFRFPEIHRAELANGFTTMTVRHGTLPLVAVRVVVRAGADRDPTGRSGLAYLLGESLESGTETYPPERLATDLEGLGVELSVDVGWDSTAIGMAVPRRKLEGALGILADVVRNPVFPEDEVRRHRDRQLASLLQRRKEPRSLAGDMMARFLFPSDVPYARPILGVPEEVRALERADLTGAYTELFGPDSSALFLVGDIDPVAARRLAEESFGGWSGEATPPEVFDVRSAIDRRTVFVVDRPGAVQSEIRIADLGVDRHHPDYFPLIVMNTILGGAFTSRLNMNLRERNGFTYGAHSGFAFRRGPGPFSVEVAVATEVTGPAVREALAEIDGIRADGARAEELDSARDYLSGILPLRLETAASVAARLADIFVHDLPDDFLQTYRQRIAAVDGEDVHRVAREHLHPERFAVVVVGDAGRIRDELAEVTGAPVRVEVLSEEGA